MKRFLSLLLTAILAVSLCACSQKTEPKKAGDSGANLLESENQTTDEESSNMEDSSETLSPISNVETDTDEPEQQDNQSDPPVTEQTKQESAENKIPVVQPSQAPVNKTETPTTVQPTKEQEPQKPVVTEQPKPETPSAPTPQPPAESEQAPPSTQPSTEQEETTMPKSDYKVKITVGSQELTATIYNNATGRALIDKLPMTLPMLDLYGREMCYRFDEALETDNVQYTGYEVGEIVYWPPRHSFVILYAQNGERFDMQKIGKIDSDIEIFDGIGDVEITIELIP